MPALPGQLLAPPARVLLFDPPTERDEALRRCALAPEDLALVRRHRRAHNQLGFAVQLALMRDLGRPLRPDEALPGTVVEAVADQLGVEPAVFELYARRDGTRREHAGEIAALLELRAMRQVDYRASIRAVAACAAGTDKGEPIARAVIDDLKERRITVPPPTLVERLALAGRAWARRQSHRDLIRDLADEARIGLEDLLTKHAEDGRTLHGWIGEVPEGPKLKNLMGVVARLQVLRRIGINDERRRTVHANRYAVLAREARILPARELLRFSAERRLATLTVFVIERQAALTDLAVEMFDKLVGTARRKADAQHEQNLLARAKTLTCVARDHVILGRALLEARTAGASLSDAIEQALGWKRLSASVEEADDAVSGDEAGDGIDEMIGRHTSLRRVAAILFETFVLRSHRADNPLLAAVGLLRELQGSSRRKLPNRLPTTFLRRAWRRRVKAGPDGLDAKAYEVAVIVHLRDRLRAGDVWVEGSRAYRRFDDYLLPQATFAALRAEGRLGLALPDTAAAWLEARGAVLREKLDVVLAASAAGKLVDASINEAGLEVAPIRREQQDHARTLSRQLYALMPRIRITDLLAEVNDWTGFADRFTHFRTGEAAADLPALMGAILADATNLGLDRMAESSRGLTIHRLNLVIDRHVRPETYTAALAAVVDAQHAEPFAAVWGPGSTSSSDGQFFPAGGRGEAASDYNARQGSEPGSVFYGFISDRFASYYSRVIAAAASEAPYVLDGLMHHESAVEIHEHTTDTAGAVESIFALTHAFGYRFAPRIRGLADRKLYVTERGMGDNLPDAAFGGVINRAAVEDNWAEVLRLAASIRAGTVPPSVMLKKLAAFPRQNALHRALREMGRVERAIFTCDWLLDPELRRRSHGNLNKGESRHALARAVFFHRLGELRDRTAEDMAHRASGLNLVVNAIVLWNTTYLSRVVAYVRSQGVSLTDEALSHVAPLRWDHIALTGDYLWSDVEAQRERFRPLRTSRFRLEAFRTSLAA
jgi:TnpA family transposase